MTKKLDKSEQPQKTRRSEAELDAFVTMSKYLSDEVAAKSLMDDRVQQNTSDIKSLQKSLKTALKKVTKKQAKNEIYFEGQIYDAYSKITEIFHTAKKKLTIIDTYVDLTILDIVKRMPEVEVLLITQANNLLTKQDIKKYSRQYHNLTVYYDVSFHDRYFIIDDQAVYHCGASVNKIGYKTFSITLVNDKAVRELLLARIAEITSRADKASV